MKRKSFLTLVSAAGTIAGSGLLPKAVFASQRAADVRVRARGDRQWMEGRAGACASTTGARLKWGVYFPV